MPPSLGTQTNGSKTVVQKLCLAVGCPKSKMCSFDKLEFPRRMVLLGFYSALPLIWNQYELDAFDPVILYLLGTWRSVLGPVRGIKDTSDFAVAGHRLPLIMVITTSFATCLVRKR